MKLLLVQTEKIDPYPKKGDAGITHHTYKLLLPADDPVLVSQDICSLIPAGERILSVVDHTPTLWPAGYVLDRS